MPAANQGQGGFCEGGKACGVALRDRTNGAEVAAALPFVLVAAIEVHLEAGKAGPGTQGRRKMRDERGPETARPGPDQEGQGDRYRRLDGDAVQDHRPPAVNPAVEGEQA